MQLQQHLEVDADHALQTSDYISETGFEAKTAAHQHTDERKLRARWRRVRHHRGFRGQLPRGGVPGDLALRLCGQVSYITGIFKKKLYANNACNLFRLLCVRVYSGKEECSLLNVNIIPGSSVLVFNLGHLKPNSAFALAVGSLQTVVTTTCKVSYLLESVGAFKNQLPEVRF